MSGACDFSDVPDCPPSNNYKETLMSKFKIPITHFEFDYIEKCRDGKELEKILKVLQSGEEGHYPDLIQTTEHRLSIVKPKSILLRKVAPIIDKKDLNKDDLKEISKDLETFLVNVSQNDKELSNQKSSMKYNNGVGIRCTKVELSNKDSNENKIKSIKSTDYRAWDKYDADTELLKMEMKEEKEKQCFFEKRRGSSQKKSVTFNKFATETEANFFSDREREKGNEYFKSGNYEEALECFTNSIQNKANIHNLNNRAVTLLKLEKYKEAVDDCNRVLHLENDNLKALLRKAQALEQLQNLEEALESAENVIARDPNNQTAQELTNRLRENCQKQVKTTRFKIIELD